MSPSWIMSVLFEYAFYYPLFMAYVWMVGGVYYHWHWGRGGHVFERRPWPHAQRPPASVLVPCHNEREHVTETVHSLLEQDYPGLDIVLINDGSTDGTDRIIDALAERHPSVRAIHLTSNQGKAVALKVGALVSPHEFLITIDGDAVLDRSAVGWIMHHFVSGPRVGAVTGNPRIRTRSTVLGRIQVGEFSSIIGLIKRAQRIYGRVFTVSGVVSGFRKSALQRVGYWSPDMVTEDIDVSWKLQLDHWDIRFEPNCLCWILMPETFRGLFRQRLRWAQGGAEVLIKYSLDLLRWRKRRMWMVYLELLMSIIWSYVICAIMLLWLAGQLLPMPEPLRISTLLPAWPGVLIGVTCLLQFAVSLCIDSRYEKGLGRYYYWMVWYPLAFWTINAITAVVALPRALIKKSGLRARWESPDRGIANSARGSVRPVRTPVHTARGSNDA
ncbi:MAG: poly-beta-1,6 N-acetyl-D-glucosamine synthase [Gammaproteobacteria bacterium]|nr:poly-beta-1,6 N-acetyl-D-glucosamine synthase [Gammaproteobacteria bacterium]